MAKRRISNKEMRDIAETRIAILLALSRQEGLAGNMERSKRYFGLAWAIGMRTKTPLPEGTLYCRRCRAMLFPGRNCRVRLRSGRIVVHCLGCDGFRRRPYHEPRKDIHGEETDQEGA